MISVEAKTKSFSPIASLGTPSDTQNGAKEGEKNLSFAALLQSASFQKEGKSVLQNGLLVLSLNELAKETPKDIQSLQPAVMAGASLDVEELLQQDAKDPKSLLEVKNTPEIKSPQELPTPQEKSAPLELNPEITKLLDAKELKLLIKDAKAYLKKQIVSSGGLQKSEIVALPKTLKGLVQVAKKLNIDVTKITIEELQSKPQIVLKNAEPLKVQKTSVTPLKSNVETPKMQKIADSSQDVQAEESEIVVKKEQNISKDLPLQEDASATKKVHLNKSEKGMATEEAQKVQSSTQRESRRVEVVTKLESTAVEKGVQKQNNITLFKPQENPQVTTQQIVSAQMSSKNSEAPKAKREETLTMLLRDKSLHRESGLTADFSVATARVIAPSATKESTKGLESLLYGEGESESERKLVKSENFVVNKADSFEVKLNEAKQMIKYISQDVKTAIADYKAPFTRVKLQLNPQRLGEIDLTVVQRGKNLHINLSANNAAINTLAMNVNDLKIQLNNNGINNASLNFNNSSQSSDGGAQNQHNPQQNQREANREYSYFENQENSEEVLSSLEIVVPHYA